MNGRVKGDRNKAGSAGIGGNPDEGNWQIGRAQSELQSHHDLVCRLLLEKKKKNETKEKKKKKKKYTAGKTNKSSIMYNCEIEQYNVTMQYCRLQTK